jgi:hypothetical protein
VRPSYTPSANPRSWLIHRRRQVTLEEATAKAGELGILFMETSAKAGHNVKSLFKKIALSLPGMETPATADQNASACLHLSLTFLSRSLDLLTLHSVWLWTGADLPFDCRNRRDDDEGVRRTRSILLQLLSAARRSLSPRSHRTYTCLYICTIPFRPAYTTFLHPIQPRFIVFPAPRGFASAYRAQRSSSARFSSARRAPNALPSSSASAASVSARVGASAEAGPPPVRTFPRARSMARYSSIDIVGRRCEGRKTSAWRRARSAAVVVVVPAPEGRMVKGRRGCGVPRALG